MENLLKLNFDALLKLKGINLETSVYIKVVLILFSFAKYVCSHEMLILSIKVSFLHFQAFKTFSMLPNLSLKFNLSASGVLYAKKTASAQIGSCGQLKLKCVSCLSFQRPSHKASVFDVLICKPEIEANFSSIFSECVIESRSRTKTSAPLVGLGGLFQDLGMCPGIGQC